MEFMQYYDFKHMLNSELIKNILNAHFDQMSNACLCRILEKSNIKRYQKNELILQRDQQNKYKDDALYILLEGIIQIGYLSPSGRFHTFNYHSEKSVINLFNCLQDHVPEYDYYAFNQVKVLVIPKHLFLEELMHNNAFSQQVMCFLALRMHYLTAELKFLHVANLHQKISKILLKLAHQYGVNHSLGTEIKLKISQHDLADLLSASRQTVNKEIKKLVGLEVLNWQYENIIVKDLNYLKIQSEIF